MDSNPPAASFPRDPPLQELHARAASLGSYAVAEEEVLEE
jgi:hypothetical protein